MTNRNVTSLLLAVVALAMVGCGAQSGRFVTTGAELDPLLVPVGSIDIVSGYENGSADVSDRHLLYLLVLTPGLQQHWSGPSGSDFGEYVTTLNHNWDTDAGKFAVSVSWNRKRDVVTIGSQEFQRRAGDVFIVTVNTNGSVSGEQLPTLSTPAGASRLLQYVQQQRPNDKRISSVVLLQR
jgi:hypothetical protein